MDGSVPMDVFGLPRGWDVKAPARLVQIAGVGEGLYALDDDGQVWMLSRDGEALVWVPLVAERRATL